MKRPYIQILTLSFIMFAAMNVGMVRGEEWAAIDLDQIPMEYGNLYFMPSYEEAMTKFSVLIGDNPVIIASAQIDLNKWSEGWAGYAIYYSKEKNEFMEAAGLVYGDDTGIYGGGIPFRYLDGNKEIFYENVKKSFFIIEKTRMWENQYGPYFTWNLETKDKFSQQYGFEATVNYNSELLRWGLPGIEELSEKEARALTYKAIADKYGIDVNLCKNLREDIRYYTFDNEVYRGYWVFNYWVKLIKDGETYYSIIFKVQNISDDEFAVFQGIDPKYLSYFIQQ